MNLNRVILPNKSIKIGNEHQNDVYYSSKRKHAQKVTRAVTKALQTQSSKFIYKKFKAKAKNGKDRRRTDNRTTKQATIIIQYGL